jgi:SAM-dependent methyltransferase
MKICLECQKHFVATDWHCPRCGHILAKVENFIAFAPQLANQNDGFNPALFAQYAEIEASHFWFVGRNKIIGDAIRESFTNARNMLEIGCGNGIVLAEVRQSFPQIKLYGGDVFFHGLTYAAKRVPEAELCQMDAMNIPFWEEFDIVGAFDVLEHIDDDERALRQLFRACRSGGGIVVTVPQHPFLWSRTDEYAHHKRRYTRKELVRKVEQAGFAVERVTSFVSLLLPLMMLSRFMQRKHAQTENPIDAGFMISKPVNKLLGWLLGLERKAIRLGVSFPAGGSLLLVARKGVVPYKGSRAVTTSGSAARREAKYSTRARV